MWACGRRPNAKRVSQRIGAENREPALNAVFAKPPVQPVIASQTNGACDVGIQRNRVLRSVAVTHTGRTTKIFLHDGALSILVRFFQTDRRVHCRIVDLRPGFKRKAHYFFDRSGTTRSEYTIILSYRVPADASNVTLFPYDIVIVAPWSRSGNLKYSSLPVFMAGIVLGWPSPIMEYMLDGRAPVLLTPSQISWMVACIDIGNFAMAVPAGWLMNQIGRKYAVTASAPLMFTGWMFILFSRQLGKLMYAWMVKCGKVRPPKGDLVTRAWCLYVARLLQGAAVGIAWVVAPAYVGEMASIGIRGKLSLLVQLSYALGLLFSYFAGWLLGDYAVLAIVSASVSVISGLLFLFLPESPYYLMLDDRPDDAATCLWSLRSYTDDDLQTELLSVKDSILND
ncbi:facilitated trehalose transporter Tret1-like, partial [Aphis craccivora]